MNRVLRICGLMVAVILLTQCCGADDWPQWRGSRRDAISTEKGLQTEFPEGFAPVWKFTECGVGYCAPAVVGDRLYLMGANKREDGSYNEFVLALDSAGMQIWRKDLTQYAEDILLPNWGHGPRGTLSYAHGKVFGLGANGDLFAMDAKSGDQVWRINIRNTLGGEIMGGRGDPKNVWGYSESPLAHGEHVICTPGGKQGSVAALDAQSGRVVWQTTELTDPASYTSVVPATFFGVPQYVVLTAKHLVGLQITDGKVLWQADVPLNEIAIISTPVISGNQIYISAAYNTGCSLVELKQDEGQFKADIRYSNKTLANHHGGVVLVDGRIYGWSGNTNSRGRWVCQNLASGEAEWTEEHSAPAGSVVAADGHIYCYTQEDGELICIKASPEAWNITGRFTIPQRTELRSVSGKVWTHPVIANGKLYLRDQDLLFCYDIKGGK